MKRTMNRLSPKLATSAGLALCLLGPGVGCSDNNGGGSSSQGAISEDAGAPNPDGDGSGSADAIRTRMTYGSPVPYTPGGDVDFIDFMVPHHLRGIAMSDLVIQKGMRMDVKDFAIHMKQEDMAQVGQMRGVRTAITGSGDVPPPPPDPQAEQVMAFMMTQAGASLDELYITHTIASEGYGIEIAQRALPNMETMDMRGLAGSITENGATAISQLQAMRQKK
jgi:uncharacterized protein (DUF305 family)